MTALKLVAPSKSGTAVEVPRDQFGAAVDGLRQSKTQSVGQGINSGAVVSHNVIGLGQRVATDQVPGVVAGYEALSEE